MSDQFAVVPFTTPGGIGTFDITDPAITETFRAALLLYGTGTTDDANQTHGLAGVGFVVNDTDGVRDTSTGYRARNGQTGVTNCLTFADTTDSICLPDTTTVGNGATDVLAAFSSAIAGGVRMNASKANVAARGSALLFAGISRAWAAFGATGTPGTHHNCGLAGSQFRPDIVFFTTLNGGGGSGGTASNDAFWSLGFAVDGPGNPQISVLANQDNSVLTTDSDGEIRSNRAIVTMSAARAELLANLTSFDSTGFNLTASAGMPDFMFLAIKFADARLKAVAIESLPGSTGNADFTSFGFTPLIVVTGSVPYSGANDTLTDGSAFGAFGWSMFKLSNSQQRALTARHREGLVLGVGSPSEGSTRYGSHAVLNYDHLGAVMHQADIVGPLATGYRLNFSTAAASAKMITLGIGSFAFGETVNISDSVPTWAVKASFGETVNIQETTPFRGAIRASFGETVDILDAQELHGANVTTVRDTEGPRGVTAEGGPARGSTVEGGPAAGATVG